MGERFADGHTLCPVARWPWFRDAGELIIPDGQRFLDIDQAAALSGLSMEFLRQLWRSRISELVPGAIELLDLVAPLPDREPVHLTLARLEVKLAALAELTAEVAELRALLERAEGGAA